MSQTLLAPSPVAIRPLGAQDVRPSTHDAGAALPFARQQTVTPGGWIAGIVFGLVCLGTGVVLVVACLLAAVALAVVGLVRGRSQRATRVVAWGGRRGRAPVRLAAMPSAREIVEHKPADPPSGQSSFLPGKEPGPGVEVVPYDPRWPEAFRVLEARVRSALGDRVLAIDHVGSTAVPGLAAKPIIDIALIVADPADEGAWVADLESAGFDLVIREPWWYEHRALRYRHPRANLHVYGPEAPEPVRERLFRDWLIAQPADLALYQEAKLAAAAEANAAGEHVMQYNARKEQVIRDIYDRAFRAAGLL